MFDSHWPNGAEGVSMIKLLHHTIYGIMLAKNHHSARSFHSFSSTFVREENKRKMKNNRKIVKKKEEFLFFSFFIEWESSGRTLFFFFFLYFSFVDDFVYTFSWCFSLVLLISFPYKEF